MKRITPERMAAMHGFELLWVPIPNGEKECCNCGTHFGGMSLPCGHHYCSICVGRGRDDDHVCGDTPLPTPFNRADYDCHGCGQRHDDWETCADEMAAEFKAREDRIVAAQPPHVHALRVVADWAGKNAGGFDERHAALSALHVIADRLWRMERSKADREFKGAK